MKKISVFTSILAFVAIVATVITSAFTDTKKSEAPLFVAPSVMAIDHFNGEPLKVFEVIKESNQQVEGFKSAAQAVSGVNLQGAKVSNGRISRSDLKKDDPTAHFEYDATTGAVSFSKGISGQLKGGKNLPEGAKASSIASKFLNDNKLAAGDQSQMEVQHIGGIKRATKEKEIDVLKTVTYTRKIEGVPVTGQGSKIIVELGNDGEVLGMDRHWREVNTNVQAVQAAKIKTQEEAEKEIGRLVRGIYGNVLYKVLAVQKMYFDNEGSFIQPVFLFEFEVYAKGADGKKTTIPMVQPVSMLKNAPEKIGYNLEDLKAELANTKGIIGETTEGQAPAVQGANIPKRQ